MQQPETLHVEGSAVLPLLGRRVLVTRAEDQAGDFIARLRALGAEPLVCPTIRIVAPDSYAALDAALRNLACYDWIVFASANGVSAFADRAAFLGAALHALPRIAAIGPATADALSQHGIAVDFVPHRHIAEGMVVEIEDVNGKRILLPAADIARPALAQGLRERGADVTVVTAYRTVAVGAASFAVWLEHAPSFDVATFTSSSTVQHFVELAGRKRACAALRAAVVICIGPKTAQTARELGVRVDGVAAEHTTDGLLRALVAHFALPKE